MAKRSYVSVLITKKIYKIYLSDIKKYTHLKKRKTPPLPPYNKSKGAIGNHIDGKVDKTDI